MDKEHIKGAADKAKGAVKEAAGKMTGDREMQAEGKFDKAKGAAHKAAGDIKGRRSSSRTRFLETVISGPPAVAAFGRPFSSRSEKETRDAG
jgi:uncharacterized protein YjbJ (UPF0337 family)